MTLEIVKLKPRYEDEYEREMIETLETWLIRAKEGRFASLALVAVCKDGSVDHEIPSGADHPTLVGAVTILQYNMLMNAPVSDVEDDE